MKAERINKFFKVGKKYSRNDVHEFYLGTPLPKVGTGNWTTGYVRPKGSDDLVIFMNIGIPGKTGHDFDNEYDSETKIVTWFGKPNTHSEQPLFKKLLAGDLNPYFFARYDQNETNFNYLGSGLIEEFIDNVQTQHGLSIKLTILLND